jgi:hypothetical protein
VVTSLKSRSLSNDFFVPLEVFNQLLRRHHLTLLVLSHGQAEHLRRYQLLDGVVFSR